MKNFRLAALSAVLLCGIASVAFAQEAAPIAPTQIAATPLEGRFIEIENVPSFWMAYWLDPKHNVKPNVFAEINLSRLATFPETEPQGAFTLPDGIVRITSDDASNRLMVVYDGNQEAIRQLQELISVLDQPLRQVEIEAQVVEMDAAEVDKFRIQFSEGIGEFRTGAVRNDFTARINALVAAGQAKTITAPRVTAINNLSTDFSLALGYRKPREETAANNEMPRPFGADLKITPTINGDETITLLMKASAVRGDNPANLVNIVNLRDGDTLAITGLSRVFAREVAKDPANVVVFLTARIIRHKGEVIKAPGK